MPAATIAHLADRSIMLPETKVTHADPSHVYEPMRGFGAHLAVFDADGRPIGYIDTRTLGYETARDWLAANPR